VFGWRGRLSLAINRPEPEARAIVFYAGGHDHPEDVAEDLLDDMGAWIEEGGKARFWPRPPQLLT
jgi:hypothetical protein